MAKRKNTWPVLRNVEVKIGFAPGDVADQLASNQAGGTSISQILGSPRASANMPEVQFLALAAALLSLGSHFKAAQTPHFLLDESSPQGQLLLTIQQLKGLLVMLSQKIGCSGFVDCLEGWDMILKSKESGMQPLFLEPDDSQIMIPLRSTYRTPTADNNILPASKDRRTGSENIDGQDSRPEDIDTHVNQGPSADFSTPPGQIESPASSANDMGNVVNEESLNAHESGFQPLGAENSWLLRQVSNFQAYSKI